MSRWKRVRVEQVARLGAHFAQDNIRARFGVAFDADFADAQLAQRDGQYAVLVVGRGVAFGQHDIARALVGVANRADVRLGEVGVEHEAGLVAHHFQQLLRAEHSVTCEAHFTNERVLDHLEHDAHARLGLFHARAHRAEQSHRLNRAAVAF
jgi:hypothetical protein